MQKNAKNRTNTHENEDYDFWSMPNNESNAKKRKDFVADSGLWVNDKDIDKSVFITDQKSKKWFSQYIVLISYINININYQYQYKLF